MTSITTYLVDTMHYHENKGVQEQYGKQIPSPTQLIESTSLKDGILQQKNNHIALCALATSIFIGITGIDAPKLNFMARSVAHLLIAPEVLASYRYMRTKALTYHNEALNGTNTPLTERTKTAIAETLSVVNTITLMGLSYCVTSFDYSAAYPLAVASAGLEEVFFRKITEAELAQELPIDANGNQYYDKEFVELERTHHSALIAKFATLAGLAMPKLFTK